MHLLVLQIVYDEGNENQDGGGDYDETEQATVVVSSATTDPRYRHGKDTIHLYPTEGSREKISFLK